MDNIQCSIGINKENKTITIKGLSTIDLTIDFSNDIDFTELVLILTSLIDNSKKIELAAFDTDTDEKLKLILETIAGIIGKYNESISVNETPIQEAVSEDSDLPF